jgi:hypothetical protein
VEGSELRPEWGLATAPAPSCLGNSLIELSKSRHPRRLESSLLNPDAMNMISIVAGISGVCNIEIKHLLFYNALLTWPYLFPTSIM